MLRLALALSVAVVAACAFWESRVTAGNGPDRSVDLRPVVPLLVGGLTLAVIWVAAIVVIAVKSFRRPPDG